jgi:hypothetical protein
VDDDERAAYELREQRGRMGRPWRRLVAKVLAPDPLRCGICGRLIDKSLPKSDPWSKCVDHIIAIIDGGEPLDPLNTQPAHLWCNLDKEARRKAAVASLVRQGLVDYGRVGGLQQPAKPRERAHGAREIIGGSP